MQRKSFLKPLGFILPIGLVILLFSSAASAQDIYSVDVVTPSYIETDTSLYYLTGDDAYVNVELPFTFTFYKKDYKNAYVSTNGYLSFTEGSYSYSNTLLPTTDIPNAAVYAFWDDLFVDAENGASVRTRTLGTTPNQRFVIEWRNVAFSGDNSEPKKRVDFEIVLHENGIILLQYRNIADNDQERGKYATVGIEDEAGNSAVQFSPNQTPIGVGEYAIRFAHLARRVPVDVRPMACPNPLNVGSQGVLPVAILGTSDLDVKAIDPSSLTLAGGVILSNQEDPLKIKKKIKVLVSKLSPLRWSFEDVGTPYGAFAGKIGSNQCNNLGPDGHLDLLLKFDTQAIVASLGDVKDKEPVTLQLRGRLQDGTEISGEDVVIIIKGN
jgi:hypothetical protein